MGGFLADRFGMDVTFLTMGGLNLLAFFVAIFFLPEVKREKAKEIQPSSSLKEMSASGMLKAIFSFQVTYSFGRGAFSAFLPILAGVHLHMNPTQIGILVTVNILLMSFLQVYGGNISDRFNRYALTAIGGVVAAVSLSLFPLGANFWQLLGITVFSGFCCALGPSAASALSVDEGRKYGMASAMSVLAMAFSLGVGAGSLLGGVVSNLLGINSVFYFGAGVGVIGTILFLWFARSH